MAMSMLAACVIAVSCTSPSPDDRTEFALGDRGFSIVAAVEEAASKGFTGVVLAADGGEVVVVVSTGSGEAAIRPDTLFEIASTTKPFTAVAIMRLVQEGKLSLEDSIADHLPGVPEDCRGITVRHLLQHTSGIPGTNSQGAGDDLALVLPVFLLGGPRHEPGTNWDYWNQGYALLSEIIARAAGEPYTEYMHDAIFEPAGMKSTLFTGEDAPDGVPVATGVSGRGPSRGALEHPYGSYGLQYRGMGGIVTNVWDLWGWDRALHGNELLDEDSKNDLFNPGLNSYALGWIVREGLYGQVQEHGGAVRGFVTDLRRYPDRDAFIVVLCANDRYQPSTLADQMEGALFTTNKQEEVAGKPEGNHIMAKIVGNYSAEHGTTLEVTAGTAPDRAHARISWGAGGFPDTHATIENTENGLVLNEGDPNSGIRITPNLVEGVVTWLSIISNGRTQIFTRVEQ